MASEAARRFFSSPAFAVAGASQDASKYGHKLLHWYHAHKLPVTALNPRPQTIALHTRPEASYTAITSLSDLANPTQTSLSIVTPPMVTRQLLKEAHQLSLPAVWLQPGSFDAADLAFAQEHFDAAVGGEEGGTRGHEGWCVLVDGERALQGAGKL